jgi:hypothetical protein
MKSIPKISVLPLLAMFFLLALDLSAQTAKVIEIDCRKNPDDCGGTKLTKKKTITTIYPPDFPISMQVAWNNTARATPGAESRNNLGFKLKVGWAPGQRVVTPFQVVPTEAYARANGISTEPLLTDQFTGRNARTPYWEGGVQLTNLSFADLNGITNGGEFQLSYLDIIPVGVRMELSKRLSVGVGASYSLLLNATYNGREITDLATAGFNQAEPGMIFDFQFGKRGRGLQAGISYHTRFSLLNDDNLTYGFTQFSVGWGFGGPR